MNWNGQSIAEMTDSHILNAIAWARRTHSWRCEQMAFSAGEFAATTGGDGAAFLAEQVEQGAWDLAADRCDDAVESILPAFGGLLREAKRRKLVVPPGAECNDQTEWGAHR